MAWSDLSLTTSTLKGLASVDWKGAQDGDVKDDVVVQARAMLADLLIHRLSGYVTRAGGREALLDSIEASSPLAEGLAALMGRSYLHLDHMQKAMSGSSADWDRALYQYNPDTKRGMLITALDGFASSVPEALELTTDSASGTRPLAVIKSVTGYERPVTVT